MIRWLNRLIYFFLMFCFQVTMSDYFRVGGIPKFIAGSILWAYFINFMDIKKAEGGTA